LRKATIHGYADQISVAPGETIRFMVSCEEEGTFRADIVRMLQGDTNPTGPGVKEEVVATPANGEYPGRFQPIHAGSHVVVDDPSGRLALSGAFTLHAFIYPTTPLKSGQYDEDERSGVEDDTLERALPPSPGQGILTRFAADSGAGYGMTIDDGKLTLVVGTGSGAPARFSVDIPLVGHVWYSAAVSYDPASGQARIYQRPVINAVNSHISRIVPLHYTVDAQGTLGGQPADARAPFLIAGYAAAGGAGADTVVAGHYNGKIDRPKVFSRALSVAELDALTAGGAPGADGLLANWDFADGIGPNGIPTDRVADAGPHGLHGLCVNLPARGMTGYNWQGREEHFIHAPEQYGAIHFHDDDIEDCRWQADFELTIPADMQSDSYAAKLTLGEAEDYVPFFVLPPRGTATSKILLLIPTGS
jgi:N,N-dimethylformamidase